MDEHQQQPEAFAQSDEATDEVVDGVLVLADIRAVTRTRQGPPAFVQTAAVAATGFVAGAATAAVLGRRFSRAQARRSEGTLTQATSHRRHEPLEVVSSRSYIVDVHTLARRH